MRADRHPVGGAVVRGKAGAAYRPGLLALREGRLLDAAVRALPVEPEVVIANATGHDHPRGAGLALHLGAVLELPSIGVTDRPLTAAGAEPTAVSVVLAAIRRARTPEPLRRARREARRARAAEEGAVG
jgi:deoxyribonuclease V